MGRSKLWSVLAILVLFLIYTALSIPVVTWLAGFAEPLAEWGPIAGPLVFAVLFSILATVMVPSSFMKLVAGALFGFWGGLLAGWLGAMGGAIIPFMIARHLLTDGSRAWMENRPFVTALDQVVEEKGLTITVLIRLSLVVPYNIINWVLGPSRIRTRDYMLGNVMTFVPTILYAWWGSRLGDLISLTSSPNVPRDGLWWSSMIISLALTIIGIVWLDNVSRKRLEAILSECE